MTVKKIVSLFCAFCLFLSICFCATGEVIDDTSTTTGIDVVIVLDMTRSMVGMNNRGNDPSGYRIDATAMLIGMMDMDGSRVAIVPFAAVPGKPVAIKDFTNISDSQSRINLINEIYSKYPGNVQPDTNIGAALMKAEQMLLNRDNQTNRPMIVLMTDGQNDITNDGQGRINVPSSLRWENGQIVDKGPEWYSTETADIVTYEAFECAKANSIPVYTVALGTDPSKVATGRGISLVDISLGTGALECQRVNKEEAQNLPAFFAKVLANQIGSSVEYTAAPKAVEGQEGLYEVKIPILNEKVLETNVILPVRAKQGGSFSGIDPDSIELVDSTGVRVNGNAEVTMLRGFNNSHFSMIKIREPKNPGMWTLRFRSDKDPSTISFNILYKYNLKFSVDVVTTGGGTEYYKTDKLSVKARFKEEGGAFAEDPSLYQDHTGEEGYADWMTIRSAWKLYRASSEGNLTGDPLKEGTLTANTVQNQFETQIDLADGERLASGNYLLEVVASGAGFDRTVLVPLELKNHAPIANDYSETIEVNSTEAGQESTWSVEGTSGQLKKSAKEIVSDPDRDDVQFDLRPVDNDQTSIAVLTLDQNTGIISYKTVQNGEKIRGGTAKYMLYYNDQDKGTGSVPVSLVIHSDVDAVLEAYELEVKITGSNAEGSENNYLKNTPLTISARLKEKESQTYAGADLLAPLKRSIQIADMKSGESIVTDGELVLNSDALEYRVPSTGNREAEWSIKLVVDPFDPYTATINIPNANAPVPKDREEVSIFCDGQKVPGFLSSVVGKDTPEDDPSRIVTVKGLFSDKDGDQLEYGEPRFMDPATENENDTNIIWAEKTGEGENAVYTIRVSGEATGLFRYSMESEMHLTAKDGDGREADYVRKVTIVDLFNKMLTYILIIVIAIVTLVILYLIIHQIRKPRFPRLNMTIRKGTSYYESSSETLSPVKSPMMLNAIGVGSDLEESDNALMELLQSIIVYPVRSSQAVGVVQKKLSGGYKALLSDVELKPKKKYTWQLNDELSICKQNGENIVAVKLEDRSHDEDQDVANEFGSDDEWSSTGDTQAATATGRKHSRKVQRTQKKADDEPAASNTDDFDF